MTEYRWVPDEDWTGPPARCQKCGSECEALRVEPMRSRRMPTHIHLCTEQGCRRAWQYVGGNLANV